MIEIHDYKGDPHYVASSAVAHIARASASSSWHGIRAFVTLFDGTVIESSDGADFLNAQIEREKDGHKL